MKKKKRNRFKIGTRIITIDGVTGIIKRYEPKYKNIPHCIILRDDGRGWPDIDGQYGWMVLERDLKRDKEYTGYDMDA